MNGLLAYLAGPGRANEHDDAYLVAGDDGVMLAHGEGTLTPAAAQHVARLVDHPHRAFATRVTVPVKRKDSDGQLLIERPATRQVKDADVWHCSLSLHSDEGALSDEQWTTISEQFVAKMGFADPASEDAPCRWIALRHGLSKNNNDHVHIVVSLVREDGSKASTWNDRPRAQQAAGELERENGLQVLESRGAGRGGRESNPAERGITERRETAAARDEQRAPRTLPPTAREQLTRIVRASAAASADEAEFVRRVVRARVRIRPRFAQGTTDVVAGYSAALRTPAGVAPDWYGGGRLARDLTLPRLRAAWPDTLDGASAALAEWSAAGAQRHPVRPGREAHAIDATTLKQCEADLRAFSARVREVPIDDRALWAQVAHETAGAFAAWSLATEPAPGPLAATAESLARSAQLRAHQVRPRRAPLPSTRGAALVLASVGRHGIGPVAEAALLKQLSNTATALRDAHEAAGDAQRAEQLRATVTHNLHEVHARLSASSPPDADAAEAVRLARRGFVQPTADRHELGEPPRPDRPPRDRRQRDDPER